MEPQREAQLHEIMKGLAGGDRAMTWSLYAAFGPQIGAAMRKHLASMGLTVISPDELDGLVFEACMIVHDVAGSWSPDGGATPWHYARHRLRNVAKDHIGQHADLLDDLKAAVHDARVSLDAPAARPGAEREVDVVMADLVVSCEPAALLEHAFNRVRASERDRNLLLEHTWQEAEGDRSPAHTLAPLYEMSTEAVRQAVSRLRRKLRALVETDAEFSSLADLPVLA